MKHLNKIQELFVQLQHYHVQEKHIQKHGGTFKPQTARKGFGNPHPERSASLTLIESMSSRERMGGKNTETKNEKKDTKYF